MRQTQEETHGTWTEKDQGSRWAQEWPPPQEGSPQARREKALNGSPAHTRSKPTGGSTGGSRIRGTFRRSWWCAWWRCSVAITRQWHADDVCPVVSGRKKAVGESRHFLWHAKSNGRVAGSAVRHAHAGTADPTLSKSARLTPRERIRANHRCRSAQTIRDE